VSGRRERVRASRALAAAERVRTAVWEAAGHERPFGRERKLFVLLGLACKRRKGCLPACKV